MENNPRSASQSTRGFTQRLKEDGWQTLEQRKRTAADRVEGIAQALQRTIAQLSDNEPTLAEYANRLATTVGNLATRLREGSIDELVDDTRAFARRNPSLFIAGGALAGFVLARFVKASARRPSEDELSADDAPTLMDEVDEGDEVEDIEVESDTTDRSETTVPGYTTGPATRPGGGV